MKTANDGRETFSDYWTLKMVSANGGPEKASSGGACRGGVQGLSRGFGLSSAASDLRCSVLGHGCSPVPLFSRTGQWHSVAVSGRETRRKGGGTDGGLATVFTTGECRERPAERCQCLQRFSPSNLPTPRPRLVLSPVNSLPSTSIFVFSIPLSVTLAHTPSLATTHFHSR